MKHLILPIALIICSLVKAQDITASIEVKKNNVVIESKPINSIDSGDVLSFTIKNATNHTRLLVDGYTIRFFQLIGGKEGKQIAGKEKTFSIEKPGNSITIPVKQLYQETQFSKITIELNQPYYLSNKNKIPLTIHHTKRSFTFLL